MENEQKILIGKKGEDKYKGWILPPNTWTTIPKMWIDNGDWHINEIHVSKTPKNWQRTETCKKILKLINQKI